MRRVPSVLPFRTSRRTRWAAWLMAAASAVTALGIPAAASAAPTTGADTGLHDTMLPPDSPDAQGNPGVAADTRAGTQADTQAGAGQLLGIDVSHFQNDRGAINWAQVAANGQSFAIMKATEGVGWTDPYFRQN